MIRRALRELLVEQVAQHEDVVQKEIRFESRQSHLHIQMHVCSSSSPLQKVAWHYSIHHFIQDIVKRAGVIAFSEHLSLSGSSSRG
jgi:hypothetical protein